MKIALGSTSEAKKAILLDSLKNLVTEPIEVIGVDVESGITDQPLDEATTIRGSSNRAKNALEKEREVDFAIGLEGGLEEVANLGYFLTSGATIYDPHGHTSIGVGGKLQLPKEVSEKVKSGGQFGEAIREYEAKHEDDENVLPLVNALISRKDSFEQAIQNAYLSYKNKKHF